MKQKSHGVLTAGLQRLDLSDSYNNNDNKVNDVVITVS